MTSDAPAPHKPRFLSNYQIRMLDQCPYKWWLAKVARAPTASAPALVLGKAFHEALEEDANRVKLGQFPLTPKQLLDVGGAALDHHQLDEHGNDTLSLDTMNELEAKLRSMLIAYVAQMQRRIVAPVDVEHEFDLTLSDEWHATGRLDLILPAKDGSESIIDHKTTTKPWKPGRADEDEQATLYLLARPAATSVTFAVYQPVLYDNGTSGRGNLTFFTTKRTSAQLDAYASRLSGVAADLAGRRRQGRGAFWPRPQFLCCYCDYRGACEYGRAYLAEHRIKPRVDEVPFEPPADADEIAAEREREAGYAELGEEDGE